MKEIIKSINKKLELIDRSISEIHEYINSKDWFEICDNTAITQLGEKINRLNYYHNDYNDMYSLLQSFRYSVSNYDTIFYEEIEAKWLDLIIHWFNIENEVPNIEEADIEIEMDTLCLNELQSIMNVCQAVLISDTQGINRFSLKYLSSQQKNLISFSDYKFLYGIKKEYSQKKNQIDEIQNFGEEALTSKDKRTMRIHKLSFEAYLKYLKNKSEDFSSFKSFKSHKSDFLLENKESIISKPFEFSFVNSVDYINSRMSQKDYYIAQTFTYILEHQQEFGINISQSDFEYLIVNKKLPSEMNKIAWKGSPTDAFIFCKLLNIELSRFNRCFNLSNGKPLKSNSAGKNPQTDFAKFTRNIAFEFDSVI